MQREKHGRRLDIRLTEGEYASLGRAADRYGLTLSQTLRFLVREDEKRAEEAAESRAAWRSAREEEE